MFEFMHPFALLLLLVVWGSVYWLCSRQNERNIWKKYIDKRFLPHLLKNEKTPLLRSCILLGVVMTLMVIALASPSWRFKKETQGNEISEVVWVVRVSDSMMQKDLFPSRLKRAVFKMQDYLQSYPRTHSALVAYSGSAHLVMPMSKDTKIISLFASSLTPEVMPIKGDALYDALRLAAKQFVQMQGSIVVLSDSISEQEHQKINKDAALRDLNIIYYKTVSEAMQKEVKSSDIMLSRDERDIKALHRSIKAQYESFQSSKKEQRENDGYYLLPLIALLMLVWFQKGFLAQMWRVR